MSLDISKFRGSSKVADLSKAVKFETCDGKSEDWRDWLSGHVFIVAPYHRKDDLHLFSGEGVIIDFNLKCDGGKIKVRSQKLTTWDSFWHQVQLSLGKLLPKAFFPARIGLLGVSEIANTGVVNMDGRLILTADAGRYWEVEPDTLETATPIGYFDEHIVSVPLSFFPMVSNTAHPFYDRDTKELISCELKAKPRPGKLFTDMISAVYITKWDGNNKKSKDPHNKGIRHWELEGTILDGSPHTAIVTEKVVMIPDMPFQMGLSTLLGLKIPLQKSYHKTQIYLVDREELKDSVDKVPSRLLTFEGDSYHFLCNYHHREGKINLVAVQQATISLTEAIEPDDVRHFNGERYQDRNYHGVPWMFAFDPGVLRKVEIEEKDARLVTEEAFYHPGWFSTMLHTADSRELYTTTGYSAIYQVYAGYYRDLICRRQYLSFRDRRNRILQDKELPQQDLPSVLAKVPLNCNWDDLSDKIKTETEQNPDTPVAEIGKELLDFYICPEGYVLDSVQFIPQGEGYIFATILNLGDRNSPDEAWLFAANCLQDGPIAKLDLPINFGFTLHSEYFDSISQRTTKYNVSRFKSAMRSLVKVPYEYIFNQRNDILNRKVN
ncbi:carotenoid oxygenase family protein [Myxosarcina sp. GI1]|uniref:carotenoid oxygenase family protein n=1 Tax=Myxosarcina sp. GI1 TaxID=1541065 RepID=UPI0005688570|nr:carotenoid oxygenase family protein [Myxosarcina sp. GI1]